MRSIGRFSKPDSRSLYSVDDFNSFFASNFQEKLSDMSTVEPVITPNCNSDTFSVSSMEVFNYLRKLKRGSAGLMGSLRRF